MSSSTSSRLLKSYAFVFFVFCSHLSFAQEQEDTSIVGLDEVVIKAYEQGRRLREYQPRLTTSARKLCPVWCCLHCAGHQHNTRRTHGRAFPWQLSLKYQGQCFAVAIWRAQCKSYYNDLPYTHPGGQTYFNNFGNYNFSSIEIIKGPGSSLYGAGTGGVVLAEHLANSERPGALIEYTAGSFGLHNIYGSVITGTEKFRSKIGFQHQESDGYRAQSALQRDVLTWTGDFNVMKKRKPQNDFCLQRFIL
jgi:iron complex outermembrane receptor protein